MVEVRAKVVILGNGGAALGLLSYMSHMYDKEYIVLRRSDFRDKLFPPRVKFMDFTLRALKEVLSSSPRTLLIQSTSAPLKGDSLESLSPAISSLQGALVDIVYGSPSHLFECAKKVGLPCINGLPMLVEQAVLSQEYWWGQSIDSSLVYKFLRESGFK